MRALPELGALQIFVDLTSNRPDIQQDVLHRLKGPLLTLMAAASTELAYTVLVHIHALLGRGPRTVEAPWRTRLMAKQLATKQPFSLKLKLLVCLPEASCLSPARRSPSTTRLRSELLILAFMRYLQMYT